MTSSTLPSAAPASGPSDLGSLQRATLQALQARVTADPLDTFLPPAIRNTVGPVVTGARWAAVLFGMLYAAPRSTEGDLGVVTSLTIALFFTSWRTFQPVRLGSPLRNDRIRAVADAVVFGAACGISEGLTSPFAFCLVAAVLAAALGWSFWLGMGAFAAGCTASATVALLTNTPLGFDTQTGSTMVVVGIAASGAAAFIRSRLVDAERKRLELAGQVDLLNETNDLLHILNEVARTLPTALDQKEAGEAVRMQLRDAFRPTALALLATGDEADTWVPRITDGVSLEATLSTEELPTPLAAVASSGGILRRSDMERGVSNRTRSGMYAALGSRGEIVGLVAIEHPRADRYTARDERILAGLTDVLGLTLDNAKSFGRLRSLGAEGERTRIARDLHDRLGQWLTYINFELERILGSSESSNPDLMALHGDVQKAIDELRETLRQLRTTITEEADFATVATDLVARFGDRTGVTASFVANAPGQRLAVPVENELLRILQEALNNVEKHAKAENVDVLWDLDGDDKKLVIRDDGRGFDRERGVRDNAYGLVGMRERADAIEARLDIESARGAGTTITVVTR